MTVAEVIVAELQRWGVTRIYGVAGSSFLPLLAALDRASDLRFFGVRHEEAAALMASAEAKLTGGLGVCLAHAGPGAAQLVNGLYDAHGDRVPVLALTGQVPTARIGTGAKQWANQSLMFSGCTGFSRELASPETAVELLTAALRYALTSRDVAHLALPLDLLTVELAGLESRGPGAYLMAPPIPDGRAIDEAAELLKKAKRPVILAGRGARGAAAQVLQLAEALGAPLLTSLLAKGAWSEEHPLVLGPLGAAGTDAAAAAAQAADVALVLGSTWWPGRFWPSDLPVIQVDLRPAVIGAGKAVAVGIAGEVGAVVPELRRRLPDAPRTQPEWPTPDPAKDSRLASHPANVGSSLRRYLPDDSIVTVDTGLVTLWYGRAFPARREVTLVSGRWRTMGFGLPAALAAKLVHPARTVVALVGDGGLTMTWGEFLTAVRYDLKVTVVVQSNGLLGEEAARQELAGLPRFGTELERPDFAAWAEASGGLGIKVEGPEELGAALAAALRSPLPAVVDVPTLAVAPPDLAYRVRPGAREASVSVVGGGGSSSSEY